MRKRSRKRALAEINVVPYIDVMLVLLVIFMITAPLLSQGVNVQLPHASAKTLPPQKDMPIVMSVDQSGHYYLNVSKHPKQSMTSQQVIHRVATLLKIAKKHHQTRDVYVKGDRRVDYGKVVQAMILLQQAGATQVGLITQSET